MFFKRFFNPTASAKIAREIYLLIVAKARQPYFYAELGVPDTVDGRFDMITLHAILVIDFITKGGKAGKTLSQQIFDEMFAGKRDQNDPQMQQIAGMCTQQNMP